MNLSARNLSDSEPLRSTPQFQVYHGRPTTRVVDAGKSNQLSIQCLIYNTLVNGISSASSDQDFRGVTAVSYPIEKRKFFIVFAMWYSTASHQYFLTSLGQYSHEHLQQQLQTFRTRHYSHLQIQLEPIHPIGLVNLTEKLVQSNLPSANVILLEDTIDASAERCC